MRKLLVLALIICGLVSIAEAKTVHLDDVIAKATQGERENLIGLLEAIKIVPTKNQKNGNMLFKVEMVAKDSVYDREGVKVGDLVYAHGAKKTSKSMNIETSLKK